MLLKRIPLPPRLFSSDSIGSAFERKNYQLKKDLSYHYHCFYQKSALDVLKFPIISTKKSNNFENYNSKYSSLILLGIFFFNRSYFTSSNTLKKGIISKISRGTHVKRIASQISGKTPSSTQWLRRKARDPYTRLAHEQGLAARSAFKLEQILNKNKWIKARVIVDIGAAPGGWTQIVQRHYPRARIICVDRKPMKVIPNTTQLLLDFTSDEAPIVMFETLKGLRVDLLLSDMAPDFCGNHEIDHVRLIELAENALNFGIRVLRPGATAIFKINRGGTEKEFKDKVLQYFEVVKFNKPDASFKSSSEIFVTAFKFKGHPSDNRTLPSQDDPST